MHNLQKKYFRNSKYFVILYFDTFVNQKCHMWWFLELNTSGKNKYLRFTCVKMDFTQWKCWLPKYTQLYKSTVHHLIWQVLFNYSTSESPRIRVHITAAGVTIAFLNCFYVLTKVFCFCYRNSGFYDKGRRRILSYHSTNLEKRGLQRIPYWNTFTKLCTDSPYLPYTRHSISIMLLL